MNEHEQDYIDVMNRGKWLNEQMQRKEFESGVMVACCAVGCGLIFLCVIFVQIISNL